MVAYTLVTHHIEIIAGILRYSIHSHIAALAKTLTATPVAFVQTTCHLLVTTCRATMSIFGRR